MKEYEPVLQWVFIDALFPEPKIWKLMYGKKKKRCVATVWQNMDKKGTWHTWDVNGVGGENWIEDTVAKAKVEAAASAIAQGFI